MPPYSCQNTFDAALFWKGEWQPLRSKKGHECHSYPQVEGAVCTYQLLLREQGGTSLARPREGRGGSIKGGICRKGQVGLTGGTSGGLSAHRWHLAAAIMPLCITAGV